MEAIALAVSILTLGAFGIQLIKRLLSLNRPTRIHLKVGSKEIILSERADEHDARKMIKYLKAQ